MKFYIYLSCLFNQSVLSHFLLARSVGRMTALDSCCCYKNDFATISVTWNLCWL